MKSGLFWVALVGIVLWGCAGQQDQGQANNKKEENKEEAVPVEVAILAKGPIESVIQSAANLEAEETVQVFSRTTNQLIELLVEEGDYVKKGQVLARLESDTQTILLAKGETRFEKAKKEYDRKKDLIDKELITVQEYNDATYELKQSELQVAEAKQELEYTEIKASISGTVTSRLVKLGDQVNINQHLFDIVDFESLVALIYLPERNLARLQIGQQARLNSKAMGDRIFTGNILRIAPTVDASTGTVKVTIEVDDTKTLRPGMYVDVDLVLDTRDDALLIPKRALVYDSDQLFIYRMKGEDRVERILVEPLMMDKDNLQPVQGFQEGDRIVIAGQTGLKDGALVTVLIGPEPAATERESDADKSESTVANGTEVASQ